MIEIADETYTTQLLVTDGKIAGAVCVDLKKGDAVIFKCPAVILANGGSGCYRCENRG